MARLKKTGEERSPKNKERQAGDVKTIGLRVSAAYAEWLARAAAHDRVTIAAFLDRAALDRAKGIGFVEAAPPRIV